MITEQYLPIERKGIDVFKVRNFLHIIMLAEPGWVIPAGRYERRYAALAFSEARRGNKEYFLALHRQIDNGGAEAMFHDLLNMDLGDWHPRDIPLSLLAGAALQKQQSHNLPPMEQWYVMLLHEGILPGEVVAANKVTTAWTKALMENAIARVPRLRYELTEVGLLTSSSTRPGSAPSAQNTGRAKPTVGHSRHLPKLAPLGFGSMVQRFGITRRSRSGLKGRVRNGGGCWEWRVWTPYFLGYPGRNPAAQVGFHTFHTLHTLHLERRE
jgi:hypothetical protein